MRRKRKGSLARTVLGVIAISIGVVVCSVGMFFSIDAYCRADINHWMPLYPGAELIDTQNGGFFRVRASGITNQTYYSPDSPNDVRQWYRDHRREITSGQHNANNPNAATSGIATTRYQVIDDPDSEGSIISYYSECAYN